MCVTRYHMRFFYVHQFVQIAGAHGIHDLPCATKLWSWMGYQGWSPWRTCFYARYDFWDGMWLTQEPPIEFHFKHFSSWLSTLQLFALFPSCFIRCLNLGLLQARTSTSPSFSSCQHIWSVCVLCVCVCVLCVLCVCVLCVCVVCVCNSMYNDSNDK